MIRSMSAHLHVGIPFFMSIAPDLESALRAVRRGIDQRLAAR